MVSVLIFISSLVKCTSLGAHYCGVANPYCVCTKFTLEPNLWDHTDNPSLKKDKKLVSINQWEPAI